MDKIPQNDPTLGQRMLSTATSHMSDMKQQKELKPGEPQDLFIQQQSPTDIAKLTSETAALMQLYFSSKTKSKDTDLEKLAADIRQWINEELGEEVSDEMFALIKKSILEKAEETKKIKNKKKLEADLKAIKIDRTPPPNIPYHDIMDIVVVDDPIPLD